VSATPKILVVAGGEWQVPLVQKVKSMGFMALNSNLYPDSPAFQFADGFLVADVRDREKNLAYARAAQVSAVITDQSDIAVPTVAYVCEQLGLPGIGTAAADLFTDKLLMRHFCATHGFPAVKYRLCREANEIRDFTGEVGFPCVVKPPRNQSSRGVTKVSKMSEIDAAWQAAKTYSDDGRVLAEQFIGGVELTVEGIKLSTGHVSLCVSRKRHYDDFPMVARQLLYGHQDEEIDYEALKGLHDQLINAMGLPFGITHAEYKYDEGTFYLIETAARGGGTRISSDIVPLMSGVDVNALLVRLALGETVASPAVQRLAQYVALDFWEFPLGRVASITGLDQVLSMAGVVTAGLNIHPGDEVRPPADDRVRHGFVIARSDSLEGLQQLLKRSRETIQVHY
jgi:biotin carboxylase